MRCLCRMENRICVRISDIECTEYSGHKSPILREEINFQIKRHFLAIPNVSHFYGQPILWEWPEKSNHWKCLVFSIEYWNRFALKWHFKVKTNTSNTLEGWCLVMESNGKLIYNFISKGTTCVTILSLIKIPLDTWIPEFKSSLEDCN